jgi:hypothetical protein
MTACALQEHVKYSSHFPESKNQDLFFGIVYINNKIELTAKNVFQPEEF